MDGLIFCAGRGTRLAPLTDTLPKALVEVGGVPLLEHVARRLVAAGVDRLVLNVCPFADRIEAFVASRGGFGVPVVFSREAPDPLETGGGLLAAAPQLRRTGPILLHNVDVLTDFPLRDLVAAHARGGGLATLAVSSRPSSRRLLFDDRGLLGRADDGKGTRTTVRAPLGPVVERAFAGVHAIDPRLLDRVEERGVFSIVDVYLRLAAEGEAVLPHAIDGFAWLDVGRPADLARARDALR